MINILANDGIHPRGKELLEGSGFTVYTEHYPQENLAEQINKLNCQVLVVRSATKVTKDIIEACKGLKIIARAGVGTDNIDKEAAKKHNITVINTPAASSRSVAELVFSHLWGMSRHLFDTNRKLPLEGDLHFKELKKSYSNGTELLGKTLGIVGFGRIGREVAKIALAIGMKVMVCDKNPTEKTELTIDFIQNHQVNIPITYSSLKEVLKESDFITLHVPVNKNGRPLIGKKELELLKPDCGIINTSRGGVINETDLLDSLNNDKIAYAGLDVFENEPTPSVAILMNEKISLSPHIGASTLEAQERIGVELANQIINYFQ